MKVVQINSVYGTKSTGIIVRDIADLITSEGHTPLVITPGRFAEPVVQGIGNRLDYKLHALYTRLTGKQGLASSLATLSLLQKLKRLKPDIIHLHNIHSNFINYRMLLRYTAEKKIPVVLTLHDCWFLTGKCYHFYDIGCEKWKTGCNGCPKRYSDIPSYLGDNAHRVFELRKSLYAQNRLYVVGCSQWITNTARESPVFAGADIRYIYNGVDTQTFKPRAGDFREKYGISQTDFVIITMANKWFDPENERIRTKILRSMAGNDWLFIVGCKEAQLNQFQAETQNQRVIAMTHIDSREKLAKVYCAGNVFLNLTHIDTLPTVNMEAASCGLPVITYQAGGSGELVAQGRTGYVIENFDDNDALMSALSQVKAGAITADACREKALNDFDRSMNYRKYLDLYREICNQ